uniref:Uncharacterized protein n=1 Tax=Geladintestivirus 5 TaxID=3233137 RepID=A0AAU8MHV6_9CAUD
MGFTINIAKGLKKSKASKPNRVSRLCIGTTIKEGDEYKIQISLRNDPEYPDFLVVPFTKQSLELKGKVIVYSHKKDKYNHYIEYHRDSSMCKLFPGLPTQYTAVIEKLVCSGYVIRKDNKLMFDLKETHGFGDYVHDLPIKIDESKPLFPSNDKHNTD